MRFNFVQSFQAFLLAAVLSACGQAPAVVSVSSPFAPDASTADAPVNTRRGREPAFMQRVMGQRAGSLNVHPLSTGCLPNEALCNCTCIDITHDPNNCGGCGITCVAGQTCSGGSCIGGGCSGMLTMCGSSCVNTQLDSANCGSCGNACPTGTTCSSGVCGSNCVAPYTMCGSSCVDTSNDPTNCGSCGHACASGEICRSGACAATAVRTPGSPCVTDADCAPGGTCWISAQGWPGGYCSYHGCNSAADCGANGYCNLPGDVNSACFAGCTSDSDCRADYFCMLSPFGDGHLCAPRCEVNPIIECGSATCNAATHMCTDICTTDADCSPGSVCDVPSGACLCTQSTNCGPGFGCGTLQFCGCASDSVCGVGHTCDRTTGGCT